LIRTSQPQNKNDFFFFFLRGLTEGTVNAMVLSSQNRREKEDRIGESQPKLPVNIVYIKTTKVCASPTSRFHTIPVKVELSKVMPYGIARR
jgi:hypothetical protein